MILLGRSVALYAILVALVAAPRAIAQKIDFGKMTVGVNGEWWHGPDTSGIATLEKIVFLRGVYDGVYFSHSSDVRTYPAEMSWNTLIDALDQFYAEPANRQILVVWALRVVRLQIDGKSPPVVIDAAVRRYRCRATVMRENPGNPDTKFFRQYDACGPGS